MHWVFESVDGRQLVEALVAAIVLEQGYLVGAYCRFFIVEVRVGVDDLTTLITPSWILPREVLKLWLDVPMPMPEHELRP